MSALPWWKRISRKSPANLLIQKSPSSKSSSTTLSTTTTTRKTTTTSRPTTSTLRSIARSPTTPLTTSTTTTRRRNIESHNVQKSTNNSIKPYSTPKPLVKKSRTRSQLRSLISGHSRRNRKQQSDTRSSTAKQDDSTTTGKPPENITTPILPSQTHFEPLCPTIDIICICMNFPILFFFLLELTSVTLSSFSISQATERHIYICKMHYYNLHRCYPLTILCI